MTDIDKLAREIVKAQHLGVGKVALVRLGLDAGELRGLEKAIAIMDSEEVTDAMDCNKVEKYAVHKSTLELAKSAIRSAL